MAAPGWGQGARTGELSSSQLPFGSSAHSSWPQSEHSRTEHASHGGTSACVCVLAYVLTGPRPELLAVYPCSTLFPLGSFQQMQGEMA